MKKIAILSPCGTGNLGDEATVAVLVEEIKRRYPHAEIFALTSGPSDTRDRHGIAAYPARNTVSERSNAAKAVNAKRVSGKETRLDRLKARLKTHPYIYAALKLAPKAGAAAVNSAREMRFIANAFKRIRGTDLLIVAGSGQLCDNFYGVWGFPYTLLKWSILAKTSGAKLTFLSCGAGPIDSSLSRFFIRCALQLADYRSFRDQGSKELAEKIGINGSNPVFPDLVFSSKLNGSARSNGQSRTIAINAFPHYDNRYWPVSSPDVYSHYVKRLAAFTSWLIKNNYTVLLFPTQLRADPLVIEDVKRVLMTDAALDLDKHLVVKTTKTFDDLIAQLSQADIVVASRFHGILISFLLNKPVLALSHHAKVDNLMRDMGQSDYLLNIDEFDLQTVTEKLVRLESRLAAVKQQIRNNVRADQILLESQYSEVFQ